MSLKCYYHPEREAQSKCEKCGKLICLECKKAFNKTHKASERSYSTRHEYCQVCYFNHMSLAVYKTPISYFAFIIVLIIFLIITNVAFDSVGYNNPMPIFLIPFIIVLIIAFIFSIIHGAKKREDLMDQKNSFLLNLKNSSSKKKAVIIPTCKKCGKKIDSNIIICPHCGCDIKE